MHDCSEPNTDVSVSQREHHKFNRFITANEQGEKMKMKKKLIEF